MRFKSTRTVGGLLGVNPSRLQRLIWEGRLTAPERGPGNSFCWADEDIDRASRVLLGRPYAPEKAAVIEN